MWLVSGWLKSRNSAEIDYVGFNDTSTLVGHFVSSPREKEKGDRIVEEMRGTGKKEENE